MFSWAFAQCYFIVCFAFLFVCIPLCADGLLSAQNELLLSARCRLRRSVRGLPFLLSFSFSFYFSSLFVCLLVCFFGGVGCRSLLPTRPPLSALAVALHGEEPRGDPRGGGRAAGSRAASPPALLGWRLRPSAVRPAGVSASHF